MKVTIYNDILASIREILQGSEFETIALDTNQLEESQGLTSLIVPALYISLGEIAWEVDTHYYFTDETEITLTIASQSTGASVFDLLETVTDKMVDKWLGKNGVSLCQNLTLKHTKAPETVDGLTTMEIVFTTTLRQERYPEPNKTKVKYVTETVTLN